MAEMTQKNVLALSSEVGVGDVGLSIARFVFAGQQINAISLPTVLLASRPDLGTMSRFDVPDDVLADQLSALEADGWFERLDGVMTGYFATGAQIDVVANTLSRIRKQNAGAVIMVDPVLGDVDTGLYVGKEVAVAQKDCLISQADIITPNLFELSFLLDQADIKMSDLVPLCQTLDVPNIVVTSAAIDQTANDTGGAEICTALFQQDLTELFHSPYIEEMPKGTGDVFASYLLSSLVNDSVNLTESDTEKAVGRHVAASVRFMEQVADRVHGSRTIAPYLLF